jgi:hypothetical protein
MRSIVAAFAAATAGIAGIHCSAPVDAPPSPDIENVGRTTPERADGISVDPPMAMARTPRGLDAIQVRKGGAPEVTSTTTDETGAVYATGTFVGSVNIGSTPFKSRGDEDVFLMKLDAKQNVVWVKSVGSASAEISPKVSIENGRVTVSGITKGQMDCGSGPLQKWADDTFFVCAFDGEKGDVLSGGVFPLGNQ